MIKVLIDTDVILDYFFDRQPYSVNASRLLSLCEESRIKGFITPVAISNCYYLLRKTAKHEKVIEHLKKLMQILDIAVIDKEVVIEALNSDFKDFEDALQNFSTLTEKKIKILITRNIKDYKESRLSIMDPDTFLRMI